MALIIALVNKSDLAEVSDYEVNVFVNERHIAGPFEVKKHRRSDGWQKLVKQFAKGLKNEKFTKAKLPSPEEVLGSDLWYGR